MKDTSEPFFRREGEYYLPQPVSRSPWDAKSLHGRLVSGLLAYAVETKHLGADFMPARFTVDLYRLPDFSPLNATTRVVRDGRRIKVIDAELFSAGVSVGRASCQMLLCTQNSSGATWSPPNWDVDRPELVAPPEGRRFGNACDMRPMTPVVAAHANKRMWMREVRDLIEDVPLTPWQRAVLVADFANGYANSGAEGLGYINSDFTMYLHRMPRQEWIGLETVNHQATNGVAIGECFMYDSDGPIGASTVCGLAQRQQT